MWMSFSLHIQPERLPWKQPHIVVVSPHGMFGIYTGAAAEISDADCASIESGRSMKMLLPLQSRVPKLLSAY
jgi:hypothetical protein